VRSPATSNRPPAASNSTADRSPSLPLATSPGCVPYSRNNFRSPSRSPSAKSSQWVAIRGSTIATMNAVVAVLHDLNVARRHADKVLVIHAGRSVAYGTPHDVLVADRLSSVYDHPIRVVETRDGTPFITPGD